MSMSARRAGQPDDYPGILLGLDEDDCLGCQGFAEAVRTVAR